MAEEYPTLNDLAPSWADIKVSIPIYGGTTVETLDIAAVKWSDTVELGVVRGTSGGTKRKRTRGQYDCDASITFYTQGWRTLRTALASVATSKSVGLTLVAFDILVMHTTPALTGDSDIHEVKIEGCRVIGRTSDMAEGTDGDQIEIPLNPMRILEDGVPLL